MTRRRHALRFLFLLCVVLAAGRADPAASQTPEEERAAQAAERWSHIPDARAEAYSDRGWELPSRALAASYLEDLWHLTGTPGISVAVFSSGRLVFSEGIGYADLEHLAPATAQTVYNVGSVSKVITAVAVLQLVEQGKVSLDDPIQTYVSTFPEKSAPVTVWHLLTHTSGIRHYRDTDFPDESEHDMNWRTYESLKEALEIFQDDPLLFTPGEYYGYSSYATNLLQGVVETASGLGFEEYLRRYVWEPAGMLQTSLDVPDRIVPHRARGYLVGDGPVRKHPRENVTYKFAGGGMLSTAEDLARMGQALLEGHLLKPESVRKMWTPQLDEVVRFREGEPLREEEFQQTLMWRIRRGEAGRNYVNHCGSVKGFNACIAIYVDEELVVATADNADSLGLAPARVFAEIFRRPPSGLQ